MVTRRKYEDEKKPVQKDSELKKLTPIETGKETAPTPDELKLIPEPKQTAAGGGTQDESVKEVMRKFAQTLSVREAMILKAVAAGDSKYVLEAQKDARPTAGDIRYFVDKAMSDPTDITTIEDIILERITRETDKYPDSWRWEGRRARYRIAAANLNKRINEHFNTGIPVEQHALSKEALKAHYAEKQKQG